MPPNPGEEVLATVYADLHYYFAQPTTRPILHRFDKASYFYFLYNATRRTSRIEVANNPGSSDQDAFSGYLDRCRITSSYKFPTFMTILVDSPDSESSASPTSPRSGRDAQEWRLASADPRDQGKNLYRLHTLDVYFWAQDDARRVTDLCKRFLHPSQLDLVELDEPQDRDQGDVTPVVQNLEDVAISDPAYRNGQTRNSLGQSQAQAAQLPPPPPPPSQVHSSMASPLPTNLQPSQAGRSGSARPAESPASFAPLAYNPAAPAAPEPIAHREDTPPPPDADSGTGLAAALHDQPYNPGMSQASPYTGVPVPGSTMYGHYGSPAPNAPGYGSPPPRAPQYGSPPGHAQQQSSSSMSFGPPPSQATPPQGSASDSSSMHRHTSTAEQHYVPHQPMQQQHQTPVQTPGTQFYSQIPNEHQPLTHVQPQYADYLSARPQPPPGGYSQYSYDVAQQQRPSQGSGYDVHSQVYRPTEAEANKHHHSSGHRPSASSSGTGDGRRPSRFDQGADKVEKIGGKLWKKLEKKIG